MTASIAHHRILFMLAIGLLTLVLSGVAISRWQHSMDREYDVLSGGAGDGLY